LIFWFRQNETTHLCFLLSRFSLFFDFFLIKKYFDLIVALHSNLVWFSSDTVLLPIQGKRVGTIRPKFTEINSLFPCKGLKISSMKTRYSETMPAFSWKPTPFLGGLDPDSLGFRPYYGVPKLPGSRQI
jgi:hypothetical protein